MKSIVYFIFAIVLGIVTISLGISAIKALFAFAIVSCLIDALIGLGTALLSIKCFKNI